MMRLSVIAFVLTTALSWTMTARADDLSLVLLSVTQGPGVAKPEVTPIETGLVKELAGSGKLLVMPKAKAEAALTPAKKKELTKCKKDATCLAGIGAALQGDLAGTLEVTHVAKGTSVSLVLIAVKTQRELATVQKTFKAKAELPALLKSIAVEADAAVLASAEFGAAPPVRTTRVEASATEEAPAPAPTPAPKPKIDLSAKAPPAAEPEAEEEAAPAPTKKKARRLEASEEEALAKTSKEAPAPEKPTRTSNGFVLGFDFGYGLWGVDPEKLAAGFPADVQNQLVEGEIARSTAGAFTKPLHNEWRPDINLHLGWNILGYASIEGVFRMSWWDLFVVERGGTGLAGGRATIYPFQFFMPNRSFDVGIEGGGGYSIAGGPTYGMDGSYAQFGITGEYYLGRNISVGAFYRLFLPMWNHFYVDYNNHIDFEVKDFMASWNTLGVSLSFHVSP